MLQCIEKTVCLPMSQGPGSGSEEPDPDLWSSLPTHAPSLAPQFSVVGASAGWHRNAHLQPQWGRTQTEGYLSQGPSLHLSTASVDRWWQVTKRFKLKYITFVFKGLTLVIHYCNNSSIKTLIMFAVTFCLTITQDLFLWFHIVTRGNMFWVFHLSVFEQLCRWLVIIDVF